MSDSNTVVRAITVDKVRNALGVVVYHNPDVVEVPEPRCDWPQLCDSGFCRFPRYSRAGHPVGLAATVLFELGFPLDVLKALDREYEMGELLHPGVKVERSRNAALARIDYRGIKLLAYLQNNQKAGLSWEEIRRRALRPGWMIKRLDARRRPWLY